MNLQESYKDLEWELRSPRDGNYKRVFLYNDSLERIKKEGGNNARHPYPHEAFSLICDGIEEKLSGDFKRVYDDMYKDFGEWLSMAWQRKGDKIILYADPENLKWDGSKYVIDGKKLIYSNENEFPLAKDIPSERWIGLDQFDAGLIQFLYSRPFAQLPKKMRDGDKIVQLYLPHKKTLWPLGGGCGVFGSDYRGRASRWVREKNYMGEKE